MFEWEKKNIREKVIYVAYGEKCVCLNDNQGVLALCWTPEEADDIMILHAKHASDRYRDIAVHTMRFRYERFCAGNGKIDIKWLHRVQIALNFIQREQTTRLLYGGGH